MTRASGNHYAVVGPPTLPGQRHSGSRLGAGAAIHRPVCGWAGRSGDLGELLT